MIPAAAIYDVTTGARTSWFAGPARGGFAFDRYLYVGSDVRLSAWDLATGARVLDTPFLFARYHPSAKCFAVFPGGPQVKIGRVSGQLARWRSPTIAQLATTIARDRDFAGLVVLGDALEAAGCDDAEVLAHCRAPGPHGEHCWVVDALKAEPLLQR
jgi:hypothetical protein